MQDPSQRVVSLSCLFARKLVTALVVAASSTGINHRIEGDPIRLALATLVAECYGISTRQRGSSCFHIFHAYSMLIW